MEEVKKIKEIVKQISQKGEASEKKVMACADCAFRAHDLFAADVCKSVEKYIEAADEDHKLPLIYILDGILMKSNRKLGSKDKYKVILKDRLPHIFESMKYAASNHKIKLGKVLVKWRDFGIYSPAIIDSLADKSSITLPVSSSANKVQPEANDKILIQASNNQNLTNDLTDISKLQETYEQLRSQTELLSSLMQGNNAQIKGTPPSIAPLTVPKAVNSEPTRSVRFETERPREREPPVFKRYQDRERDAPRPPTGPVPPAMPPKDSKIDRSIGPASFAQHKMENGGFAKGNRLAGSPKMIRNSTDDNLNHSRPSNLQVEYRTTTDRFATPYDRPSHSAQVSNPNNTYTQHLKPSTGTGGSGWGSILASTAPVEVVRTSTSTTSGAAGGWGSYSSSAPSSSNNNSSGWNSYK